MTNSDNEENRINIIDSQLGNIAINKEDIKIEYEDSTNNNLKPVNKSIIKPKSVKNMSNTSKIKDGKVKMSNFSKIIDTLVRDSKKGNLTVENTINLIEDELEKDSMTSRLRTNTEKRYLINY